MPDPFVPAGPPDRDFNETYAAVGKALSAWERLEIHLSHLYAIFVGKPWRREALIDYGQGDEGRIFASRMTALSTAAERYFARRCDQALEGRFDAIVAEATDLSIRRHQIAHGLVTSIPMSRDENGTTVRLGDGYLLVPPWYAFRRLTRVDREPYFYGSSKMMEIRRQFLDCSARVKEFSFALSPPPPGLAEYVSQHDEMDKHQYLGNAR